jgi:hypothetical protein
MFNLWPLFYNPGYRILALRVLEADSGLFIKEIFYPFMFTAVEAASGDICFTQLSATIMESTLLKNSSS